MKFEYVRAMNFENALRGMRNPKESWHLSDSFYGLGTYDHASCAIEDLSYDYANEETTIIYNYNEKIVEKYKDWLWKNAILHTNNDFCEYACIGPKDMKLAQTLIKAGSEHRKFMRQIFVSVDITAPIFWWKEFDTYKVGTVANSTSTMHKLTSYPITIERFETDDMDEELAKDYLDIIDKLENFRLKYNAESDLTKKKRIWKEMIRWLPESWLQKRTITMTYENLFAMCSPGQRRYHKLTEWSGDGEDFTFESFIKFARRLPYAQEFIFIDEIKE